MQLSLIIHLDTRKMEKEQWNKIFEPDLPESTRNEINFLHFLNICTNDDFKTNYAFNFVICERTSTFSGSAEETSSVIKRSI